MKCRQIELSTNQHINMQMCASRELQVCASRHLQDHAIAGLCKSETGYREEFKP